MKAFIKNIALFLLTFIPIYLILLNFWAYLLPVSASFNLRQISGNTFTRLQEAKTQKDVDILFLGSSHAFRGFDPRNFADYTTFNLGTSSQTPKETEILLERYLAKLNPKKVIFEVYPILLQNDGIESLSDIIVNDKNDIASITAALKAKNIKVYNTITYALIRDILDLNKNYTEKENRKDTYISGGYVEHQLSYYNPKPIEEIHFDFREDQIEALKRCITILKNKNIPVILIQTPVTANQYLSYKNSQKFDSLINSLAVTYYNYNSIPKLNDTLHFYDKDHLNQKGVNIFNKELIRDLSL